MSETIEVRTNVIGNAPIVGEYSHAFIVYTNSEGEEFYLRGGPDGGGGSSSRPISDVTGGSTANPGGSSGSSNGSSNPSRSGDLSSGRPFGNIDTEYGPYVPGTIDWNPNADSVVVARGEDLSGVYEQLKDQMDKIEDADIRYSPLGPNSNSTVATALDNVGIEPQLPAGVNAPGFSMENIVSAGLIEEANPTRYAAVPSDAFDRTLNAAPESALPDEVVVAGAVYAGLSELPDSELHAVAGQVLMQSSKYADLDASSAGERLFEDLDAGYQLAAAQGLTQGTEAQRVEEQMEV